MSTGRPAELIERLGLIPHPERGFYGRTYSASLMLGGLPHGAPRPASTAIYFLLSAEHPHAQATYLHRLRSDELFHLYEGGPLEVLLLGADGQGARVYLGMDLRAGQRPQIVIPAGTWFGAALVPGSSHCLWGCTVAPGFDFADFELSQGTQLSAAHPAFAETIGRMSRDQ